jgi:hypothetical protein
MSMAPCLTPEELTDTLIRVMGACLRRLQTTKAVNASERKAFLGLLDGMDTTGYRALERRSLMIETHRECNRI